MEHEELRTAEHVEDQTVSAEFDTDDSDATEALEVIEREADVDRQVGAVCVFNFGFRQRRALDDRPHDRLGAAVELARLGDLQELAGDAAFRVEVHRQVVRVVRLLERRAAARAPRAVRLVVPRAMYPRLAVRVGRRLDLHQGRLLL